MKGLNIFCEKKLITEQEPLPMSHFAVLDTETTWSDEVMSLGFVIADEDGFEEVCGEYYIVDPVYKRGGMYSYELIQPGVKPVYCSREDVIEAVRKTFREKQVEKVFAYNAAFDKRHLPEHLRCKGRAEDNEIASASASCV